MIFAVTIALQPARPLCRTTVAGHGAHGRSGFRRPSVSAPPDPSCGAAIPSKARIVGAISVVNAPVINWSICKSGPLAHEDAKTLVSGMCITHPQLRRALAQRAGEIAVVRRQADDGPRARQLQVRREHDVDVSVGPLQHRPKTRMVRLRRLPHSGRHELKKCLGQLIDDIEVHDQQLPRAARRNMGCGTVQR